MISAGMPTLSKSASLRFIKEVHVYSPQVHKPESLTRVLSCARDLDSYKSASTYTQRFNELLTSCASSVLLHGQPLAIESVILGTFENSAL
jgi:hypothetical protein